MGIKRFPSRGEYLFGPVHVCEKQACDVLKEEYPDIIRVDFVSMLTSKVVPALKQTHHTCCCKAELQLPTMSWVSEHSGRIR